MQRTGLFGLILIVSISWPFMATADSSIEPYSNVDSKIIQLPTEAINKLRIDAGFGWGIFNGSIYNGNDDIVIEKVVIELTPSQIPGTSSEIPLETKEYSIDVSVPPLSKGAISMSLHSDGTQEFQWRLINVLGSKVTTN